MSNRRWSAVLPATSAFIQIGSRSFSDGGARPPCAAYSPAPEAPSTPGPGPGGGAGPLFDGDRAAHPEGGVHGVRAAQPVAAARRDQADVDALVTRHLDLAVPDGAGNAGRGGEELRRREIMAAAAA